MRLSQINFPKIIQLTFRRNNVTYSIDMSKSLSKYLIQMKVYTKTPKGGKLSKVAKKRLPFLKKSIRAEKWLHLRVE